LVSAEASNISQQFRELFTEPTSLQSAAILDLQHASKKAVTAHKNGKDSCPGKTT